MDPYSCWVDGKVGTALHFNQNSYVDCGSSNKLDVYDEYTIEGWVKPSTSGINDGTNSAMTVYLDGEKIGDNTVVGAPDYPTEEAYRVLKIGGNNFQGIINEVRIFSRTLTEEEVAEHYQLTP